MSDPGEGYRCGRVAIVGRPNVGKSTLLNRFLGEKISIVSPKPETTRENLLGILTLPRCQVLFVDTPGIYAGPKTLLAKFQIENARQALVDADCLLLMTEAHAGITPEDRRIVAMLPKAKSVSGTKKAVSDTKPVPVFLAINKVDRVKKELILPQIDEARSLYPFSDTFPISAHKGANVKSLLEALVAVLPEGPALYPADQLTDKPVRDLGKEIIREKVLLFTHEEIPHGVAVVIEEWRPGKSSSRQKLPDSDQKLRGGPGIYVRATLYVERDSQKGILIGKDGALLKRIGESARREMEPFIEGSVYLDLWVKVAQNWRKDPWMLRRLGYG